MATARDLEKELAGLDAKRAELAAELKRKEEMARTNPLADLAEAMHDKFCRWNHTDGCAWHYESWPAQNGGTRALWVAQAQKVQDFAREHGLSRKALDEMLDLLGGLP